MRAALIALSFLAFPGETLADPAARAAYAAGDFQAAADRGERAGDAEGYTVAAQALLAACLTAPGPDLGDMIDRAVRDAQRAATLAPKSVDARLHYALALGLKGRRIGVIEALRGRYAQRGRALIDSALADAPNDAWAHALNGGWHFEVLRRGGHAGAKLMGASRKRGEQAFERALALAPDDPAVALLYAVALLELDAVRNEARARALLARAAGADPRDAFEIKVRDEARRLGAVLATHGAQAAATEAGEKFL